MESELHARDTAGVQDFVLLEDYKSEDAFLDNLEKRYKSDLIYVSIQIQSLLNIPLKTVRNHAKSLYIMQNNCWIPISVCSNLCLENLSPCVNKHKSIKLIFLVSIKSS